MPELGTLDEKQAASLAGLDSHHPTIRAMAREILHPRWKKKHQAGTLPALVAIQHCHKIKQKYQALIDNGKPPKDAVTAIL